MKYLISVESGVRLTVSGKGEQEKADKLVKELNMEIVTKEEYNKFKKEQNKR